MPGITVAGKGLQAFSLAAIVALSLSLPGLSKAYFPPAREAIKKAEFIALVTLDAPAKTEEKGGHWQYGEVSTAHLKRAIKGKLPAEFKIHGKEDFICAQCHFSPGENLVFLRKDKELYIGQTWMLAGLPIKDGKVAWFSNLDKHQPDKQVELETCLKQISNELKE